MNDGARSLLARRTALACVLLAGTASLTVFVLWQRESWQVDRELIVARGSGLLGLTFLLLALCITPSLRWFSEPRRAALAPYLVAQRRALGMTAAWVSLVHALVSYTGSLRMDLSLLATSPQLQAGALALLILLMLLVTSFPRLVTHLRLRMWKQLHRLVYVAALLVLVHVLLSPFSSPWLTLSVFGCSALWGLSRLLPSR